MANDSDNTKEIVSEIFAQAPEYEFADSQIMFSFNYSLNENEHFTNNSFIPLEWVIDEAIKAGYGDQIVEKIKTA